MALDQIMIWRQVIQGLTLPETNIFVLKMEYVGILVSFWDGLFSGPMLVSGSVL